MDGLGTTRARWAAIGAAVAVSVGAGGLGIARATAPAGASAFVPITPCRLADSRPGDQHVGNVAGALGENAAVTLDARGAQGNCSLPAQATGLALNVTATNQTQATFLTLWPASADRPKASNLNPAPGQPPTPNAVTVALDDAGRFSIYNRFGSVDVIVDVAGYYTDHTHDDRYYRKDETYTKAEVMAAVNAATTPRGALDVTIPFDVSAPLFPLLAADGLLVSARCYASLAQITISGTPGNPFGMTYQLNAGAASTITNNSSSFNFQGIEGQGVHVSGRMIGSVAQVLYDFDLYMTHDDPCHIYGYIRTTFP